MQAPYTLIDILPSINNWAQSDLIVMTRHIVSTQYGCSFERWITLDLGHYLSKELSIDPMRIHYEKTYPSLPGKCDCVIDDIWMEVKHIWATSKHKQKQAIIKDIARVSSVPNGHLLIFELGLPGWYTNWKALYQHERITYIPVNY